MASSSRDEKSSDRSVSVLSEDEFKVARTNQLTHMIDEQQAKLDKLRAWESEVIRPVNADAIISTEWSSTRRDEIAKELRDVQENKILIGRLMNEYENEKAALSDPEKFNAAYKAYSEARSAELVREAKDLQRGPVILSRIVRDLEKEMNRLKDEYSIKINEKEKKYELLPLSVSRPDKFHSLDKRTTALNIVVEINKTMDMIKEDKETMTYERASQELKKLDEMVKGTSTARFWGGIREASTSSQNIHTIHLSLLFGKTWKVAPAKLKNQAPKSDQT